MNALLEQRFERHPDLVSAEIGGEVVMMSIEQGAYFGLNPLASRIWGLLAIPRSGEEIIQTLLDEYEVSRETLLLDLPRFIEELRVRNLIKQV